VQPPCSAHYLVAQPINIPHSKRRKKERWIQEACHEQNKLQQQNLTTEKGSLKHRQCTTEKPAVNNILTVYQKKDSQIQML